MQNNAYLVLENGIVFKGKSFGYEGEAIGEVVFSTAMTGYIETLTDPSYYGQIVTQTFPLIGNYGIIPEDFESDKAHLRAYIVRDWCQHPSNFRCEGLLDTFLKQNKVVGLYGIDTRELTKIIRQNGTMRAKITTTEPDVDKVVSQLKEYTLTDAVKEVTCKEEKIYENQNAQRRVVLWDFGAKESLVSELLNRGCSVVRVPANTSAKRIMELGCDGVIISSGPADPMENKEAIAQIKEVMDKNIPMLGICLGHLLMAAAQGMSVQKLKYGHRGENQPALRLETGKVYITSQNQGYEVIGESITKNAKISYKNVNDGTCEGIEYLDKPAFSVQFYPKGVSGAIDTSVVFDEFVELMDKGGRK